MEWEKQAQKDVGAASSTGLWGTGCTQSVTGMGTPRDDSPLAEGHPPGRLRELCRQRLMALGDVCVSPAKHMGATCVQH